MSAPLVLLELSIRNFMSFGNNTTVIDLSSLSSNLIVGENVDANSNNGAGKTTIINAICYAFYNKPFDNISLQRLINSTNSTKNTMMEVSLKFLRGDDEFVIYRSRGESFTINITMNGDDITLDSVTENDKAIEDIVGLSYELFTKIIVFSGNSIPFLQMPISQQRAQIEELFNITLLSEKAVKLKEIIKETEGNIDVQAAVIKEQESHIALYEKQLSAAKERISKWNKERDVNRKNLEAELASLQELADAADDINFEDEKGLHAFITDQEKIISQLTQKITSAKRDLNSTNNEVKKLTEEVKHLHDEQCPYCLQKYAEAGNKLVTKEELLHNKALKVEELTTAIANLETERTEAQQQVDEAKSMTHYDNMVDALEAQAASASIAGVQQRIDDLKTAVNPHLDAYQQLKTQTFKKISYEELDALKKDLEHQQFLLKLLTDKNSFIRRKIINRTIPFLNNRLIHYTKELGLPHVVKFDDDMSCAVSEYGRELDFGNLSSGEKKRVNLSLSLAFRDVLHHLHSRVNCLFIDEIDGSLDGPGVESVFRLLKQKSRDDRLGLWIISHRPEAIGRFDKTITVRKELGFSRIVEEEAA